MDNAAKIIWNDSASFDPTDLYGCTRIAKMSKNVNDVYQEETSEADHKAFKTFLHDRRQWIVFAKYSIIDTETENRTGSLKKRFQKQDEAATSNQTTPKIRKMYHSIEVIYCVITSYCWAGK